MKHRSIVIMFLLCGTLLAQDPKASFDAANAALRKGAYEEAIKQFKASNKAQNDACGECYLGVATARLRMNDLKGTTENVDKALQRQLPPDARSHAHFLAGEAYRMLGEPKQLPAAEKEYRAALGQDADKVVARLALGLTLLRESRDAEAIEELNKCVSLLPAGDDSRKLAERMIAKPSRGRENYAPEFRLVSSTGQEISLDAVAGKMLVLDFWATWCPPCRASVPELKELRKKYGDSIVMVSVSNDTDAAKWETFVKEHDMQWPQYLDRDHQITKVFGVHAFPTYLVIDGDGIIRQRIVGANPMASIVFQLKSVLAKMIVR